MGKLTGKPVTPLNLKSSMVYTIETDKHNIASNGV